VWLNFARVCSKAIVSGIIQALEGEFLYLQRYGIPESVVKFCQGL